MTCPDCGGTYTARGMDSHRRYTHGKRNALVPVRLTVHVSEDTAAALSEYADAKGISQAKVARRALSVFLGVVK